MTTRLRHTAVVPDPYVSLAMLGKQHSDCGTACSCMARLVCQQAYQHVSKIMAQRSNYHWSCTMVLEKGFEGLL